MLTTLTNPTLWLLAGTAVAALLGWRRGLNGREVADVIVRGATRWPVLLALAAMTVAGVGTRVVLGYLAPGAYAEDVLAAQSFATDGRLYPSHPREALSSWLSETSASQVPWATVPGITPCQANALDYRARFYTEHAHPPTLLLASVPVVAIAGGRGLYIVLVALSVASIGVLAWTLVSRTSFAWRSRAAVLAVVAAAGWQPVLAGIRQGDAVLLAAALLAAAWHVSARRGASGALAAAIAACVFPPAATASVALLRVRRGGILACAFIAGAVAATVVIAGSDVIADFVHMTTASAAIYADATANYAIAPRVARGTPPVVAALAIVVVLVCSWSLARTRDGAFALFGAAALLAAPMAWSQHLALLFVPLIVLLDAVVRRGSALGLAAWAALAMAFSLPDPVVIAIGHGIATMIGPLPIAPAGVLLLWIWLLLVMRRTAPSPESAAAFGEESQLAATP